MPQLDDAGGVRSRLPALATLPIQLAQSSIDAGELDGQGAPVQTEPELIPDIRGIQVPFIDRYGGVDLPCEVIDASQVCQPQGRSSFLGYSRLKSRDRLGPAPLSQSNMAPAQFQRSSPDIAPDHATGRGAPVPYLLFLGEECPGTIGPASPCERIGEVEVRAIQGLQRAERMPGERALQLA